MLGCRCCMSVGLGRLLSICRQILHNIATKLPSVPTPSRAQQLKTSKGLEHLQHDTFANQEIKVLKVNLVKRRRGQQKELQNVAQFLVPVSFFFKFIPIVVGDVRFFLANLMRKMQSFLKICFLNHQYISDSWIKYTKVICEVSGSAAESLVGNKDPWVRNTNSDREWNIFMRMFLHKGVVIMTTYSVILMKCV